MKKSFFYQFFLEFIQDIYDAEKQIIEAMPTMIQAATNKDLKEGLTEHFEETKDQVNRLEIIFNLLEEKPFRKKCKGMEGVLLEGKEFLQEAGMSPAVKDCFIIIAAQKVEHYEIASYGSALALAKHMRSASDDKEYEDICDLLEESIKEEKNADKTLTKVAEGKLFTIGVNEEIEEEIKQKA